MALTSLQAISIDEAVSRAAYAYSAWAEELKRMVAQKTWRSAKAADLLLFLQREMLSGVQVAPESQGDMPHSTFQRGK